jgi:hypothetical protein
VAQDGRDVDVHPALAHAGGGLHLRDGPQQVVGEGDRVDPEVQEGPATDAQVVEAVRGVVAELLGVVGVERVDRTETTAGDHLADEGHVGEEPRPHRLHDEQPPPGSVVHHSPCLGSVDGEGLLHQHVLPGPQRGQGVLGVQVVRGRDVHDVDLGISQEPVVRAVRPGQAVLARERLRCIGVPRTDRGDAVSVGEEIAGHGVRDPARREDAPADDPGGQGSRSRRRRHVIVP